MSSRAGAGVNPPPQVNSEGGDLVGDSPVDPYANGVLLYHQTVIPTQGVSHSVKGSFTLPGSNDLVLVRHNVLELWTLYVTNATDGSRGSANSRSAECIHSCPLFARVSAVAAVPTGLGGGGGRSAAEEASGGRGSRVSGPASLFASGGGYDYLVVTSEVGYATLLRYELSEPPVPTRTSFLSPDSGGGGGGGGMFVAPSLKGQFVKVSEVCLGRSGARLTVPGARIAVDPNGGAILVASLMRNKVVLPIRRTTFGATNSGAEAERSSAASTLAWLGVGSSSTAAGNGVAGDGYPDDSDDDNDDDNDGNDGDAENGTARRAQASLLRGEQDEGAVGRLLSRKTKRMLAPRGVITFGSAIEAHRQTVIFSCCALDGFVETSLFAVLEQDTVEAMSPETPPPTGHSGGRPGDEKHKYLVVYAYVPSLQQVQRTHLVRVPATAHRLVPVPAAPFGPGGVMVCTDTDVIWFDLSPSAYASHNTGDGGGSGMATTGVFKCSAPLPRRMAFTETLYDPSIIAHAVTCVRNNFFLLLQDEHGDLFRVFLSIVDVQQAYDALKAAAAVAAGKQAAAAAPRIVNPLSVHYFDTIASVSDMVLFPYGFLLAGTESGPVHSLYKVVRDGYTREGEYIVKRVKRVREVSSSSSSSAAAAGKGTVTETKRKREEDAEAEDGGVIKKEEGEEQQQQHSVDDRKPKVTGKLAALLQAPTAPVQTITRVIALYQPHNALKHLALVQTYPNTPPIVSFTSAIPTGSSSSSAGGEERAAPAPPTTREAAASTTTTTTATATATATASSQPQMQFHLVAGRGSGSVLLNARFGYAARREGHFTLPFAGESVIALLSAHALQTLVRERESVVAQAQQLMDASDSILGSRQPASAHSSRTAASAKAVKRKTLERLLSTSSSQGAQLWTDKLLIIADKGTTAPYHVGRTMEPDWWTGFVSAERTLAAATLKYGVGYVQVTPRGIYVLQPTSKEDRERERDAQQQHRNNNNNTASSSGGGGGGGGGGAARGEVAPSPSSGLVQPTMWTHRYGKAILAAAATPTTVLLSFAQGGGIASFSFGLTGMQLAQMDDLPTFPPSPAVSLLLPPSSESLTGAAVDAQLHAFLFGDRLPSQRSAGAKESMELAAIATVSQEVYLVDPRKLRESVERINCRNVGHAMGEGGGMDSSADGGSGAIVSVLLTYLGDGGGAASSSSSSSTSAAAGAGGALASSRGGPRPRQSRRLFCFIGHMNGALTRCELDPVTAKVVERDELTCGTAPCKLIPGDGHTVCYVQSGAHAWRCEVRDGVAKVVPWRFPNRQTAFASFIKPLLSSATAAAARAKKERPDEDEGDAKAKIKKEADGEQAEEGEEMKEEEDEEEEEEGAASLTFITASAAAAAAGGGSTSLARDECVVAVHGSELTLFSAQKSGSGASSLEYSFTAHSLPLAGRRVLQHPTRPAYFVLLLTEHRGYSMADVKRVRAERLQLLQQQQQQQLHAAGEASAAVVRGPIPLDAPQRPLGRANVYNSTLQLFHEEGNRLLPRYFFPEGEAVLCGAVGSFAEDFGREPVVVVGVASHYTHGAGCGGGASWTQGWLCAFRFTTQRPQQQQQQQQPLNGVRGEWTLRVEPLHRTVIRSDTHPRTGAPLPPDYPSAVHICEDVGLLFVGLGEDHGLRVYVWGQQQFLRKRHLAGAPSRIIAIETSWVAPPPGSATTNSSNNFLSDLYHVPFSNPEALKRAREQRLLVFCATANHSVLVASLQSGAGNGNAGTSGGGGGGGGGGSVNSCPSFLLWVCRDPVPRNLTASLVVLRDGRTAAVADKFGNVAFLRVPLDNRNGFSLPVGDMHDAQLAEAERYISHEQHLTEIASHATGQVVTHLQTQRYDPSNGTDSSLSIDIVVYSTALGAIGAYVPFVSESDAALAAYAQPLLANHMRTLLAPRSGILPEHLRGHLTSSAGTAPSHHVIEGDIFQVFRHQPTCKSSGRVPPVVTSSVFTAEAKAAVEEELQRTRRVEAARRKALGLPARELPDLSELIVKQRALASLPQ